jgi:Mg-chelatase subunit ChlD
MNSAVNKVSLIAIILIASLSLIPGAVAHTGQKDRSEQKKGEQRDESIKIDTNLVTVPVIASDRNDVYAPDLRQDEFTLFEDGVQQEIVFFATVKEPFHVALMLDTSASAQEKLGQIQNSANAFINQLQPADRVKIISFDDTVRELSGFTSDRSELRRAIDGARPGEGTKLYDAVKLALNNLARVKGRKAIVLFTDGVDWRSDSTRYEDNLQAIEESGVIVYPIRYDTRPETEEMLRNQREALGETDLGVIFGGPNNRLPRGTTPPTVPSGGGPPIAGGRGGQNDPYRLPVPPVTLPVPGNRYPDRYPGGGRLPDDRVPGGGRYPDDRYPGGGRFPDDRVPGGRRYPDDRYPGGGGYPSDPSRYPDTRRRGDENISILLDGLYRTGDQYLNEIALKSGGRLYRADTLRDLPAAFTNIANELRNQYSLGYYPTNGQRDGKFRKIQVKTTRKNVVLRARPGYRSAANN